MADLNIGNSSANVVVNAKHNGSVTPQINNTYDLGTSALRWKYIYGNLNGNATSATNADTIDGLHASDLTKIYKYTVPAKSGVRIKYPSYSPCLVTACGGNNGAQLIILGIGYGVHGSVRNTWTELVSCSESNFTWSLPEVDEISCSVEVMNHRNSNSEITVWANSTIGFTAITALTSPKQNHVLLHSNNYTNYTVTKTGSGASGTWGININGNANTANGLKNQGRLDSQEKIDNFLFANSLRYAIFKTAEQNNVGMDNRDGMIISIPWDKTEYGAQIAIDDSKNGGIKFRGKYVDWGSWRTLLHSGNYNDYTVTKTGGGASGTWGISISGNAATASLLKNVGSNCTASTSVWNGGRGGTIVWGEKWTSTNYTYTPSGGSATTITDTGDITLYVKAGSTTANVLTLNMAIDGEIYAGAGFVGNISGNASSASKVNKKLTVGSKTFDGSSAVTITASDLGLASAMLFLGTTTTAITDGAKTNPVVIGGSNKTVTAGNVVLYGSKEFVWTGSAWEELGNEGSYKIVQAAVADPSASGTSNTFIATISQDTNGKITATKKTVAVTNSAPTLAWGSTSTIGTVAGTNLQVKMPANPNTDTKVTQTVTTSNAAYPLLLAPSGQTATTTTTSYFDSSVTLNPSTNTIAANISGNAATATNADKLDNLHANSFLRKYNANSEMNNTDELKTSSYIFTHGDGGDGAWPTGTKPPGSHNGVAIIHTHTHTGNYYTQLALDTAQNALWIRSANDATTFGNWAKILTDANYTGTLDGRYINVSGDTMTGTLGLAASKYGGPSGAHGMNCNNSDIVGVNGIFTIDNAETFSEGLNFYRSSTTWDAMTASNGTFYFGSNVAFNAGLAGSANIDAGGATFRGNVYITPDTDVGLNQNGSLVIGSKTGSNIGIDGNEIMARKNSAASTLYLQSDGGTVQIGSSSTARSEKLYVNGNSYFNGDLIIPNNHAYYGILGHNSSTTSSNTGGLTWFDINGTAGAKTDVNDTPTTAWWYILRNRHTNTSNNYYTDIAIPFNDTSIYYKIVREGSVVNNAWTKVLDTNNYPEILDGRYVNVSGDTMTGNLILSSNFLWIQGGSAAGSNTNRLTTTSGMPGTMQYNQGRRGTQIYSNGIAFADPYNGNTNNDAGWIRHVEETANAGYLEIATGDDSSEGIYVRQYNTSNQIARSITLMDGSGYSTFIRAYGAVWNDYAEYRNSDITEPGRVVIENGDGTLSLATERLQRGAEIISDTFGFAIGETDKCKTPIAVSGRVLAYYSGDIKEFKPGYPVCSGPNGTVSVMTEEEEEKYPSRIIGTVSEIPTYEEWGTGNTKVNGRIWIRIR